MEKDELREMYAGFALMGLLAGQANLKAGLKNADYAGLAFSMAEAMMEEAEKRGLREP